LPFSPLRAAQLPSAAFFWRYNLTGYPNDNSRDTLNRLKILTLILYVLLIFFMSTRASLKPPGPDFEMKDKLAHATEYCVLGLLLFTGIGWTVSRSRGITFLFLFAVGVSIGAFDELLQSYVPGREMDVWDWVADAVGVATGVGLCVAARFGNRRRKEETESG
jgi:VanZ family protein